MEPDTPLQTQTAPTRQRRRKCERKEQSDGPPQPQGGRSTDARECTRTHAQRAAPAASPATAQLLAASTGYQTQPSIKCSRPALEQPAQTTQATLHSSQTLRDPHQPGSPHTHPVRAHSMPWAPAITCLPFLDCCTLWLLQDPMGRPRPSHHGSIAHRRPERVGRAAVTGHHEEGGRETPGQQWCPQGDRIGLTHRQSLAVSHSGRAKQSSTHALQPTETRFTAARRERSAERRSPYE